ncbi:hypothetical protein BO82DRAFT_66243 [Aspergillus uvarum CBS 121591]|uniref:Uncharacterized protein n=1 Tax=Aspergillus uvarum CBS 121591 TaxID=1448315 RepID=A0A319D333_9EURO|nr:hypothetical protein BO82DRAFT_66243 [Aspergillus uvarum CBS 121591]PYH82348.1 hypothetical protein BO82DRAFT_66243 [Aspergillus uvarum CBS 121591]
MLAWRFLPCWKGVNQESRGCGDMTRSETEPLRMDCPYYTACTVHKSINSIAATMIIVPRRRRASDTTVHVSIQEQDTQREGENTMANIHTTTSILSTPFDQPTIFPRSEGIVLCKSTGIVGAKVGHGKKGESERQTLDRFFWLVWGCEWLSILDLLGHTGWRYTYADLMVGDTGCTSEPPSHNRIIVMNLHTCLIPIRLFVCRGETLCILSQELA